jgi:hypothetical protein
MPAQIPTIQDIDVHGSLDEQQACRHFLGKGLEEAESLFRENSLHYQEDLMWMGPVAFRYYVVAAVRYIESEHALGDSDFINCFAGVLEYRLDHEATTDMTPVAMMLAEACGYILEHWESFGVDGPTYGDLAHRYHALQKSLSMLRPAHAAETAYGSAHERLRAKIEAAVPAAEGYLSQSLLEERLRGAPDEEAATNAFDELAAGKWICVCGQAYGVTLPPTGNPNAAWGSEDSFHLALPYGQPGHARSFDIEFMGIEGVNRTMLILAKAHTCVLARYKGRGKASPGYTVRSLGID